MLKEASMISLSRGQRLVRALLLLGGALVAPLGTAHAQTSTGSVRGFVRSPQGAPLAGAAVEARNIDLGTRRNTVAGDNGFYVIAGLTPGPYEISVRRIGSAAQSRRVHVGVGQTLILDFRLADTAVTLGPVVVTAAASAELRSTEVGTNITREQIQNLPQNNRNFLSFATLAPGVQLHGAGLSSGGASVNNANLFIDGASYKSDVLPGGIAGQDPSLGRTIRGVGVVIGNPFPQSAVQEFRVITENYKAEYQKATGALVTASTRSGTNTLQGEIFYFGQNKNMLARDYWDIRDDYTVPHYGKSQFGGSIGGPIIRDKAHFFASYEGNYQDLENRVVFRVPPGAPPLPDSLLTGQGSFPAPLRSDLFFGKIDYQLTDHQGLIFTANFRNDFDRRDFGDAVAVSSRNRVDNDVNTFVLRHTYAPGPITNEAQLSYQRFRWKVTPDNFSEPHLNFESWSVQRGGSTSFQDFIQDRYSLRNDLTWNRAQHVVKGGVNVDYLDYDITKLLNQNPVFYFRSDQPGGSDSPYRATMEVGDPNLKTHNWQLGAYVQDDWTVNDRLTLYGGLRWDFESDQLNNSWVTPQWVRDSVTSFLAQYPYFNSADYFTDGHQRPKFYGAFQPRAGFSYDLTGSGRTVVFGGGGLFYDRDNYNAVLDEKYKFQRPQYQFFFSPDGAPGTIKWDPSYLSREGLLGLIASGQANTPEVWLLKNRTRPPRAVQASLGIRHTVGAYELSVTGTLTNNDHLLKWYFGNRDPNNGNNTVFGTHGMSAILLSTDEGKSRYRALLFSVRKPFTESMRWGGEVTYTLAKTTTNTYYTEDMFALDYRGPYEFRFIPGEFDERHHITANFIARLPFGFLASTVINLGSGYPYTLSTNCDNPADHQTDSFCATQPVGNGNFHDWDDNPAGKGPRSERPEGRWFGPFGKWAYRDLDLRLQYDLRYGSQRVSFIADAYNLFNFTNFNYDNFQYNLRYDGQQNPPRPRIPFSTFGARSIQLGVRYSF
jgi:hypothetical protein